MKELKVLVGTTADHMTEVLHTGLKNDSTPETFYLNYVNDASVVFPTRYVKVVPLMCIFFIFMSPQISLFLVGLMVKISTFPYGTSI